MPEVHRVQNNGLTKATAMSAKIGNTIARRNDSAFSLRKQWAASIERRAV